MRDWRYSKCRVGKGDNRFRLVALVLVVGWSVAELPIELSAADGMTQRAALWYSKLLIAIIALLAGYRVKWAELAFVFICIVSVLAIAPSLYGEMMVSPVAFGWSLVECVLKVIAIVAFTRWRRYPPF